MSLKAMVSSSSYTILAGARLATISQNIHAIVEGRLRLRLPFQQELHNLRHDVVGAMVQLVLREVGNGMLHAQAFIIREAPGLRHGPSRCIKHIGDQGGRWHAMLLK